jgi:outer membrane protein assembly factor BamB
MLKFTILFLLLIKLNFSSAQELSFAIITEPQIGTQETASSLIEAVNNINSRDNVDQVIVLGNITLNGKFDEFIWAQEILDGLNVPYFVIGGEKDYLLSEGNGSEISLLWGDDKKIFNQNGYQFICLNTILPKFPNKYHIEAETIALLKNELDNSTATRIFTFSYYPISLAENSYKFLQSTLDHKLFSFVSRKKNNDEIPSMEGFYLNRNDDWGYLIVSAKRDSIYLKKILGSEIKKKTEPEIVKTGFGSTTLFESIKPVKLFSFVDEVWSISTDKTIQNSPASSEGKIIAGFKNGLVSCFSESGTEKWKYNSSGKISSSPLIENNLVIISTIEGDILTLDSDTGELVQVIGIGENISSEVNLIDVVENGIKKKAIIAGTVNGNIYCYELSTLVPIWTKQISSDPINSSIAYSNNKIFFQDKSGSLYCLSAKNGLLIWKIDASHGGWRDLNSESELVTQNFNLFLIDASGNLFCIDALLGEVKWNIKNINATGLIRSNNKNDLIIPTSKNKILTISPKLGKIIIEIDLLPESKNEVITDVSISGYKMFVGFSNGWAYQINQKKKVEKIFHGGASPIISIINIDENILVTDYDGKFTLLKTTRMNK